MNIPPKTPSQPGSKLAEFKITNLLFSKSLFTCFREQSFFFLLRILFRDFVRETNRLIDDLNDHVTPLIWHQQHRWFTLNLQKETQSLQGSTGDETFSLSNFPLLTRLLQETGIQRIRIDTHLQRSRFMNSLLCFFYLYTPPVHGITNHLLHYGDRASLRNAMENEGLIQCHTSLRIHSPENEFAIVSVPKFPVFFDFPSKYLFQFTHATGNFLSVLPYVVFILFLLPWAYANSWFWTRNPAKFLWLSESFLVSCSIGWGIKCLNAIQEERLHSHVLLQSHQKNHIQQIVQLSRLPEASPHPIFLVGKTGHVIYSNEAALHLLDTLGFQNRDFQEILPKDLHLADTISSPPIVIKIKDRYIHYSICHDPNSEAFYVYGTDITHLKNTERLLKNITFNLELLIKSRTKELLKTQEVTIHSLAELAEIRDPETRQHLDRTRLYVNILAEYLQTHSDFHNFLSPSMLRKLDQSTPLHDIGKVGIPDSILLKPGRLSHDEFEIMKKHTFYGGHALQKAEEELGFDTFLSVARDIAYHHHEKWDGSGYPSGLREKNIPIPARLMALADVYDALVSRRPYKEPFPHSKAKEIILSGRGTHFDPHIVDAFLALENPFIEIATRFSEAS